MRTLETHNIHRFQSTVYPSRQPKPDVPRSRITVAQTRIESKGAALWNSIDSTIIQNSVITLSPSYDSDPNGPKNTLPSKDKLKSSLMSRFKPILVWNNPSLFFFNLGTNDANYF